MSDARAPRHFTADYAEPAVLRDGTVVVLRLLRPDDKDLLVAGFERLSTESRYARFLVPKTHLSEGELRYLTEVDQESHFAMGAVRMDPTGPIGLGIARFVRLPEDPKTAEPAIVVADEIQNQGLGQLLLLRLCAAAEERGVERFRCDVLCSNTSMRALLDAVAPERTIQVGDGVMSIEVVLPKVSPTQLPPGQPPEGPMYRFFRAAAQNAVEWTDAVRRLWRRSG